jgi:hypothetical protein
MIDEELRSKKEMIEKMGLKPGTIPVLMADGNLSPIGEGI